ncbi:MAG: hypothetical protein E6J79_04690 [Deltaproteobacteria bacterium]|nr:MAG: hypothetical protein E6J79_04690 [Deltaproteobacteria bacterium]
MTVIWFASRSVVRSVSGVVTGRPTSGKRVCSAPVPQIVIASSVPGKGAPGSRGSVAVPVTALWSVSKAIATIVLSASSRVLSVMR